MNSLSLILLCLFNRCLIRKLPLFRLQIPITVKSMSLSYKTIINFRISDCFPQANTNEV